MTVSILGCGWYGKALAKSLIKKGVIVKGSATTTEKFEQLTAAQILPYVVKIDWNSESFDPGFFECDVLVISVTPKFRHGEGDGYLSKIQRMINVIRENGIDKVIYISSTGVYGDHNETVDESNSPEPDTDEGKILFEAEQLFMNVTNFKTTIIRFAGLVGPGRHPGRFFAGKKDIPNGKAPVNLIHLDDCVAITTAIIEKNKFGFLCNASSPGHPAKADFYNEASENAGLMAPQFIDELKSWKIVNSIFLSETLAYQFKVPYWKGFNFNK